MELHSCQHALAFLVLSLPRSSALSKNPTFRLCFVSKSLSRLINVSDLIIDYRILSLKRPLILLRVISLDSQAFIYYVLLCGLRAT